MLNGILSYNVSIFSITLSMQIVSVMSILNILSSSMKITSFIKSVKSNFLPLHFIQYIQLKPNTFGESYAAENFENLLPINHYLGTNLKNDANKGPKQTYPTK